MGLKVVPKLTNILKERKITQMQFAEMTGLHQTTISRFDRNKQHTDEHVFIIAKKLNLHIEDLFDVIEVEE
jgi:transcriptional regulator with XRE-family HTH domain